MREQLHHRDGNRRPITPIRALLAACVVASSVCLAPTTGHAQVSPRMMQVANACLAGEVEACDQIIGYARGACLFGNRFACQIVDEVRTIRARVSAEGGVRLGAPTDARNGTVDATSYVRTYCNDPRMGAQLRALNICG